MAKFYGPIGFVCSEETEPGSGIWEDVVEERNYRGDVTKVYNRWEKSDKLNDNISISNNISIVADPYVSSNLYKIRYVKWLGGYWEITGIDVQPPRLVLTIGGVYNGPTKGSTASIDEHPRFH